VSARHYQVAERCGFGDPGDVLQERFRGCPAKASQQDRAFLQGLARWLRRLIE
jgi:hypothetical protein